MTIIEQKIETVIVYAYGKDTLKQVRKKPIGMEDKDDQ